MAPCRRYWQSWKTRSSDFATSSQKPPKDSRMSGGLGWAYVSNGGGRVLDAACWMLVYPWRGRQALKGWNSKCFPTISRPYGFTILSVLERKVGKSAVES